jgi:hypothetical protein
LAHRRHSLPIRPVLVILAKTDPLRFPKPQIPP